MSTRNTRVTGGGAGGRSKKAALADRRGRDIRRRGPIGAAATATSAHLPAGARRATRAFGARVSSARRSTWLPEWVRMLPPALILLALALELTTPPRYSFASLLTAAVVLASLLTRPLVTAVTGVLCTGLLVGMHLGLEDVYPDDVVGPVFTLILVTGFSTMLALIIERTTLRLFQVNAVAEATQRALMRPLPERVGPVRLAGVYRAADEAALIGGDFYGVRQTPYGVRAVIGDVRGKGIGATEAVATITSAFRQAAAGCATLSEVAARIETAMALDREDMEAGGSQAAPLQGMPRSWSQELFATAVLLEFPPGGGEVRVLNRGHPPVLRICGPGGVSALETEPALPLGFGDLTPKPAVGGSAAEQTRRRAQEPAAGPGAEVAAKAGAGTESGRPGAGTTAAGAGAGARAPGAGTGTATPPDPGTGTALPGGEASFELTPGEALVAYSDGVTEARSPEGAFYPLRQRLAERFGDAGDGPDSRHPCAGGAEPAEIVSFIAADVRRWAKTLSDDVVVVVLQYDAARNVNRNTDRDAAPAG